VTETNALLAEFGKGDPAVDYYDIGQAFLEEDGSISAEIMADFLHPTEAGYVISFRADVMSTFSVGTFVSGVSFTCGRLSRYMGLSLL